MLHRDCQHSGSAPIRSQGDTRLKRYRPNAALEQFVFQRQEAFVGLGQDVVDHDSPVDKAEREGAGLLEQAVKHLVAVGNRLVGAFMVGRKHDDRLHQHLQRLGVTQALRLQLVSVECHFRARLGEAMLVIARFRVLILWP